MSLAVNENHLKLSYAVEKNDIDTIPRSVKFPIFIYICIYYIIERILAINDYSYSYCAA